METMLGMRCKVQPLRGVAPAPQRTRPLSRPMSRRCQRWHWRENSNLPKTQTRFGQQSVSCRGHEHPANHRFSAAFLEYNPPINQPPGRQRKPDLRTRHGHALDVAASALQKAIRALAPTTPSTGQPSFWTAIRPTSGDGSGDRERGHRHRRTRAPGDDRGAAPDLGGAAAGEGWHRQLPTMHAVILMARAKKSRLVNHALIAHTADPEYREPPDYALDKHTKARTGDRSRDGALLRGGGVAGRSGDRRADSRRLGPRSVRGTRREGAQERCDR